MFRAFLARFGRIGTRIEGIEVLNGNGRLAETIHRHRIGEVVVASSSTSYQEIL